MRDERLDVFVPPIPAWKTYAKRSVLWLYEKGLLSRQVTQRVIDTLRLWLA